MKIMNLLFVSIFLLALSACSDDEDYFDDGNKDDNQIELLYLTLSEVAEYDGLEGALAYIVVQDVIYDVTDEWTNGEHNGVLAGTDATDAIMNSPHGESILEDLQIIGNIIEEVDNTTYYTLEELAGYNGIDGNPGYIAVNGIIYDVTDEWINGEHNGVMAGTDATNAIMSAPHGESVLEDLVIIGAILE